MFSEIAEEVLKEIKALNQGKKVFSSSINFVNF